LLECTPSDIWKKVKLYQNRNLFEPVRSSLVAIGICIFSVSVSADVIGVGYPGLGLTQSLGLVVGNLLSNAGFLKVHLSIDKFWARTLSALYLSMILFVGLRPRSFNYPYIKSFLDMTIFNGSDLLVNTVGFIPLGYLLMLSFGERPNFKSAVTVVGFGTFISLLLETSQYFFIPGRVSSMIDLVTNIIGTLIGITLFMCCRNKVTSVSLEERKAPLVPLKERSRRLLEEHSV
jgi:glycopeptide antibiotics resistance protein